MLNLRAPKGLIHGNTDKPSNNKLPKSTAEKIVIIMRTSLAGFGPTQGSEILYKHYTTSVIKETLRKIIIAHKLLIPSKIERLKPHSRERKAHFGEIIQGDGSYHKWFGKRYTTLVAFIDDATSQVEPTLLNKKTLKVWQTC